MLVVITIIIDLEQENTNQTSMKLFSLDLKIISTLQLTSSHKSTQG